MEWGVPPATRQAILQFLCDRRRWLAAEITDLLRPHCYAQSEMHFTNGEERMDV